MYNVLKRAAVSLILAAGGGLAITLDVNDPASVTSAAKTIAQRIVSTYHGAESGGTPGLFPGPYYWWESGLAWDALINYWAQTGDDTYNEIVNQALSWQVGPNFDYMPVNQTKSLGNDDQSIWALAAMTAAEQGFPAPAGSLSKANNLTWVQLAKNVFDTQAARWDQDTCGGGIRWQIFLFNAGYEYKNALANGNFYQLASRLALYTGNSTYSDWAQKALAWSTQVGLFNNETAAIFDGADTTEDCSRINRIQWTANTGTYLSGATYLQNFTSTDITSATPFFIYVNLLSTFTQDNILFEVACETNGVCNTDQLAFKAIASRALARARDLTIDSNTMVNNTAISVHESIDAVIKTSAKAAAAQCSGEGKDFACGSSWVNNTASRTQGLGQDLSALEIILATLPGKSPRKADTNLTGRNGTDSGRNITSAAGPSNVTVFDSANGAHGMYGSLISVMFAIGVVMIGLAVEIV